MYVFNTKGEIRDSLMAGLVGGVVLSLVLYVAGTIEVVTSAAGMTTSLTVAGILVLSPLLGFLFGAVVSKSVNRYIDIVLKLTTSSNLVKNLVKPLTDRYGMAAVTIIGMGMIYGIIIGVVAIFVIPAIGDGLPVPYVDGMIFVGTVLFGLILGGIYGFRFTV